jgi:hypothetical protein
VSFFEIWVSFTCPEPEVRIGNFMAGRKLMVYLT